MKHVDALSRNPVEVLMIQEGEINLIKKIQDEQKKDSELTKIMDAVNNKKTRDFNVSRQGVLYREKDGEELLVVPKTLQFDVIKRAHEQGHFGWSKVEYQLKQEYWFPNMRQKIQRVVNNCVKCILVERKYGRNDGWLNPIDKGSGPLHTYHVDHMGPMPSTKKAYNHLLVAVDAFTKFMWLYPVKSTTSEETVNRLKLQAVTFGNPTRIVTDRGTAFTANLFQSYCEEEGIEHILITTGVPRANGQVERMNRIIIPVLAKLSADSPGDWWKYVGQVQQFINSSVSRSTKRTPFELLTGEKMRLRDDQQLRRVIEEELIGTFEEKRSHIRDEAKENIRKIQEEEKKKIC